MSVETDCVGEGVCSLVNDPGSDGVVVRYDNRKG